MDLFSLRSQEKDKPVQRKTIYWLKILFLSTAIIIIINLAVLTDSKAAPMNALTALFTPAAHAGTTGAAALKGHGSSLVPQKTGSPGSTIYLPLVMNGAGSTGRSVTCSAVVLPKGPTLIYTGDNTSMRIFWQWSSNATFQMEWGTNTNYQLGNVAVTPSDTTNHLYTL